MPSARCSATSRPSASCTRPVTTSPSSTTVGRPPGSWAVRVRTPLGSVATVGRPSTSCSCHQVPPAGSVHAVNRDSASCRNAHFAPSGSVSVGEVAEHVVALCRDRARARRPAPRPRRAGRSGSRCGPRSGRSWPRAGRPAVYSCRHTAPAGSRRCTGRPCPSWHDLGAPPGRRDDRDRQPGRVALDPRHPARGVDRLHQVTVGVVAQPDRHPVRVGHRLHQPAGHLQPGDPTLGVDDLGRGALGAVVGEPGLPRRSAVTATTRSASSHETVNTAPDGVVRRTRCPRSSNSWRVTPPPRSTISTGFPQAS